MPRRTIEMKPLTGFCLLANKNGRVAIEMEPLRGIYAAIVRAGSAPLGAAFQ